MLNKSKGKRVSSKVRQLHGQNVLICLGLAMGLPVDIVGLRKKNTHLQRRNATRSHFMDYSQCRKYTLLKPKLTNDQ